MRIRSVFVALLVLTTACGNRPSVPVTSHVEGDGLGRAVARELLRAVERTQRRSDLPGLSVAVAVGERTVWSGAAGYADVESKRSVKPHTVFALASMSKSFLSVLVAQLIAEKAIAADERLSKWVPEFKYADGITVRQLLNSTSGITDDNERGFGQADDDPRRRWTDAEFLAEIPAPACAPGRCHIAGENAPFVLLGMLVERATRSSLASLYRKRFIEPLGLRDTFLQAEERSRGDIASGYRDTHERVQGPPGPLTTSWATRSGGAASSMASSARDVAVWTREVFSGSIINADARRLISDVDVFCDPAQGNERVPLWIGFGPGAFDGRAARFSGGGITGFRSILITFPDERITVVALTNSAPDVPDTGLESLRDEIARAVISRHASVRPTRSTPTPAEARDGRPSPIPTRAC